MKNKLIILFLALMLAGACAGCNSKESTNPSDSPSEPISAPVQTYSITYRENENCSISLSKTTATRNEVIEVYVDDIVEGYVVEKITANGFKIDDNTFIMPNENVEIIVYLKKVEVEINDKFNVLVEKNEYAIITSNVSMAAAGNRVNLDYDCKGNYILDTFYVDGLPIDGTSFIMPEKDVIVSASFKNAIEDTPWQLSVDGGGVIAKSYWYFEYGKTGINIKIIVDDRILCGEEFNEDNGFRDNIEFIINKKSDVSGWEVGKAYKILVSVDGISNIQKAATPDSWGALLGFTPGMYEATSSIKSLDNKDGYNGYEINVFMSYYLFGISRDEAINNMTVCLALRNTNTTNATNWGSYAGEKGVWEDGSTHPIILEDGSLKERK